MNPTAPSFQPSKFHARLTPPLSPFYPRAAFFATVVPAPKTTAGWPPEQPPLTDRQWNHLHPSDIPDLVFLNEHSTSWLHLKDPFAGNSFQPWLIPWWTHWCVVFAHERTNLDDSAIAKMYKHRYRNVIPGIQCMGTADALQLYTFLCDGGHRYAHEYVPLRIAYAHQPLQTLLSEPHVLQSCLMAKTARLHGGKAMLTIQSARWDSKTEVLLRSKVLHDLQEAETFLQEARRQRKLQNPATRAGRFSP